MFVVFVVLLHVSQQVSAVEMFQGDQFLLLPCGFPTFDLENPTVVWTRQDLSPPTVHQRLPEGDQLKDQNQLYRGRTSMKADALDSGDLSLNLTNLQLSDSGTYTCSVTDFGEELSRTDVELKVKGQRSLCPSCVSSERFPSWAIAILVLLVLIVSAGVLFHHRHYFMSGEERGGTSCAELIIWSSGLKGGWRHYSKPDDYSSIGNACHSYLFDLACLDYLDFDLGLFIGLRF
ncbi:myelin-oligodendrocyte glycoprotein isoform X1 [Nothobranchius furzeri]|uniref:myelin-oligodendrocyte glycoprotein isoform X1 n=1 Tax=Nothobranchius furzeri TaxID=105023 RepID=UPI003904B0FF